MRTFISIPCPSVNIDFGNIGVMNIVKPENMHLTLKFLGEIDADTRSEIVERLGFINDIKKFKISLKGVGAFPNLNYVRVLWVGVEEGSREVSEIQRKIDEVLKFKFPVEKNFTPHLTVARVKTIKEKSELKKFFVKYKNFKFSEFTAEKILLMKSTLMPEGPIYSVLDEFNLKD